MPLSGGSAQLAESLRRAFGRGHYLDDTVMSTHGAVAIERNTALCCNVGAVYTWGQNQDGQLGLGDCQGRATPTLIEDAALETHNVTQVAFRISSAVPKTSFKMNAAHARYLALADAVASCVCP